MKPLPIACTLSDAELRARRTAFLERIGPRVRQRTELADGIAWEVEGAAFGDAVALLDLERECCRFLHIRIDAEPDLGPVRIELTGPPGTGEAVRHLLQL